MKSVQIHLIILGFNERYCSFRNEWLVMGNKSKNIFLGNMRTYSALGTEKQCTVCNIGKKDGPFPTRILGEFKQAKESINKNILKLLVPLNSLCVLLWISVGTGLLHEQSSPCYLLTKSISYQRNEWNNSFVNTTAKKIFQKDWWPVPWNRLANVTVIIWSTSNLPLIKGWL